MAELQLIDYGRVKPLSLTDAIAEWQQIDANKQQQKLNEMKIAEAEQNAPLQRRLNEAHAQDYAAQAELNQQKAHMQRVQFANNIAKQAFAYADKTGLKQGTPEYDQAVRQAAEPFRGAMSQAFGHADTGEPIDVNALRSLASMDVTSGAQHNKFTVHPGTGLLVDLTTGTTQEIIDPATGKRVVDPRYNTDVEYNLGISKALPKLVEQGHIRLPQADVINQQRSGKYIQPQQVPTIQMDQAEQQALIQAAREDNPDVQMRDAARARINGLAQQPQTDFNHIPSFAEREQTKADIQQKAKIPENEAKMRDDYIAQSKPFRELSEAYQKTKALFDKAKDSAPATLAAATAYMKLLDPGSVVRESELGMALAATGKLDKAANFMNEMKNGKVLTASQIKEFKAAVKDVYKASKSQQLKLDKFYKETSERQKLNPENIIQNMGQYGDYKSPEELKAAVANGELDIEEAKDIARMKFNME